VTVANTIHRHRRGDPAQRCDPGLRGVDPVTFTMDASQVERRFTPGPGRPPVHLYGHPATWTRSTPCGPPPPAGPGGRGPGPRGRAARTPRGQPRPRRLLQLLTPARTSEPTATRPGHASDPTSSPGCGSSRTTGGASKYDNVVLGTNSRLDTLQPRSCGEAPPPHQWNEERRERVRAYGQGVLYRDLPADSRPVALNDRCRPEGNRLGLVMLLIYSILAGARGTRGRSRERSMQPVAHGVTSAGSL